MDTGSYVNEKMKTSIPWDDLVASGNLKKLLHAIVQRLDRHDAAIVGGVGGAGGGEGFVLIDGSEYAKVQERLAVLENTTLQNKLSTMGQSKSLESIVAEGQSQFSLKNHLIPLTQMKNRIQGAESGIEINANAVDEMNAKFVETVDVLNQTLQRELAKMVTKDEFKVLEDKHNKLQEQVDKMMKDLVERLEKMIKEVAERVDVLDEKMVMCETKITRVGEQVEGLRVDIKLVGQRIDPLEELMPLKADRTELEAAIQELKDEIGKLNIEEIKALVEQAAQRIDAMDERVDLMQDEARELKEYVLRKEKEMEDLQLEKQIEQLRRELEEAKSGAFMKATARMDVMQEETDQLKESIQLMEGQVQINRENIQDLEQSLEEAGGQLSNKRGNTSTVALIESLQADVANLQARYAEAAKKDAIGEEHKDKTDQLVNEIRNKMSELALAKADKTEVSLALQVKADKESVARDTQANQRAVDSALHTMNAGTQGIQQLLEQQEGAIDKIEGQISSKLGKDELDRLQEQLRQMMNAEGGGGGGDRAEAKYGGYGVTHEDAAILARPLENYNCLTCRNQVRPHHANAIPALPLLPSRKTPGYFQQTYVPNRPKSAIPLGRTNDSSVVEYNDISPTRSVGGAHTLVGLMSKTTVNDERGSTRLIDASEGKKRQTDVVGYDGRVYRGRDQTRPRQLSSIDKNTR
eukprot:m.185994 g.185994  ORF g.185994 m.185994 type:complete len:695 (+) comp32248_c0_seq3:364-2448(+)